MSAVVPLCTTDPASAAAADKIGEACITCGDIAAVLTVVATTGADALCYDDCGRPEQVAVELVGSVKTGDRLLVHAGVALEKLTEPSGA